MSICGVPFQCSLFLLEHMYKYTYKNTQSNLKEGEPATRFEPDCPPVRAYKFKQRKPHTIFKEINKLNIYKYNIYFKSLIMQINVVRQTKKLACSASAFMTKRTCQPIYLQENLINQ